MKCSPPGKRIPTFSVSSTVNPRAFVDSLLATKILGKAIGKEDLAYVQFPYEDAEKAMQGMGISPGVVSAFIEMYKGFNDGHIKGDSIIAKG